jgi:hypothetical protein
VPGEGGGGKEVAHAFQVLMITAPSTDGIHQDLAHVHHLKNSAFGGPKYLFLDEVMVTYRR